MEILWILLLSVIGTSFIWGPILIIYLFVKNRNSKTTAPENQNLERDQKWHDYIASFKTVVTTKQERKLLQALLDGGSRDEYDQTDTANSELQQLEDDAAAGFSAASQTPNVVSLTETGPVSVFEDKVPEPKEAIDNTLLLLYFGAFLLVASVGLFVALGGLDGLTRTIIVAVTAATLYFGGLWLYERSQKLAAAGISFVGSGMIIAPLTGVAWYNLVADMQDGRIIWLVTSLITVGLYAYAFKRIKNDFIAYLLIGSFISSVESSVLTIGLPTYGYAWGLVVVGIALTVINKMRRQSVLLEESAATSASLLVPLSVIGSVALFPEFGSIQLAITLALAGTYYVLLSVWQTKDQLTYRIASQVSFLAALSNVVYANSQSLVSVGIALSIVGAAYVVALAVLRQQSIVAWGISEIAGTTVAIAALLTVTQAWPLIAAMGVGTIMATVIWLRQKNDEALQVAGVLVLLLPFVIGQYALPINFDSIEQLLLSAASAVILFGLTVLSIQKETFKEYYSTATALYWTALGALLLPALVIGTTAMATVVAIMLATSLLLAKLSKDITWLLGTSLVVFIPVGYAIVDAGFESTAFSVTLAVSLIWNIVVSLITRQAFVRWLVVISILLAPVALGAGGLGFTWSAFGYSVGYMLALAACLIARAIARGKLLVSFKVPIASYYTEASQAYIFGYVAAGIAAIGLSLNTDESQWLTTVLLGLVAAAIVVVSKIERQPDVLALLPIVLQIAIFSAFRPDLQDASQIGVTAVIASLAGAISYFVCTSLMKGDDDKAAQLARQTSLYSAYVGPALVLTQSDPSILLPVSLFVAGLLTAHYNWQSNQQNRELSIGVCIAAVHWALYIAGIQNVHVHTHLLALSLAGFAYWRYSLDDKVAYESYLKAIFFVVTVPLVLQSLGNEAGGYYGLILIGEQVLFMLAGVTLPPDSTGHRFLLRWGMWTALAAILFQLRGLGWAFLSLLAIIVIGVAVYRLQKNPQDK